MIAVVQQLDDRISYERGSDGLRVVNRLPFLPLAAFAYFVLTGFCVFVVVAIPFIELQEPDANLLLGFAWGLAIMLPLGLWILFMALWSLRGAEHIHVGRTTMTVQRRLGRLGLRRRVFERRRIGRMWPEPFDRPWWKVSSRNLWATLEYHGLIRGCIAFDYGDREKRIGAKLNRDEAERLLELLRR